MIFHSNLTIRPSDKVEVSLTLEQHQRMLETVKRVWEWLKTGEIGDAVLEWENADLSPEERIAAWTHFGSKERAAMKVEQQRIRAKHGI